MTCDACARGVEATLGRTEGVVSASVTMEPPEARIRFDEEVTTPENLIDVTVNEMEFLGAFWRCRLTSSRFGERVVVADFSINAVRRLGIAEAGAMRIELPRERLLVFGSGA